MYLAIGYMIQTTGPLLSLSLHVASFTAFPFVLQGNVEAFVSLCAKFTYKPYFR